MEGETVNVSVQWYVRSEKGIREFNVADGGGRGEGEYLTE